MIRILLDTVVLIRGKPRASGDDPHAWNAFLAVKA